MKEILKEAHKGLAKSNSECINLVPQMTVSKKKRMRKCLAFQLGKEGTRVLKCNPIAVMGS